MKKRLVAITMAMVLCFAATACGEKEAAVETEAVETVEATEEATEEASSVEETESETVEATVETEETAVETESATEAETEEAAIPQIKFDVPEGFEEQGEGVYMNMEDGSNIMTVTYEGAGGAFPDKDVFATQLQASLSGEAEISVDEYEEFTISGYNALRVGMSFDMDGVTGTQTQIMISADTFYGIVAFTQQGDAWTDAFEESINSITVE